MPKSVASKVGPPTLLTGIVALPENTLGCVAGFAFRRLATEIGWYNWQFKTCAVATRIRSPASNCFSMAVEASDCNRTQQKTGASLSRTAPGGSAGQAAC